MKCPLCKRRKFNKKDEEYLEHTDRCFKCDFRIHKEDMSRVRNEKLITKHPTDISQHNHIPYRGGEND
jgi:hypothetical protein